MRTNLKFLFFIFASSLCMSGYSQSLTGYELGILAGPVQMRSDFGQRKDLETNLGNIGIGAGVTLHLNPIYWGSSRSYVFNHFKLRFELFYSNTELKHYGDFVDPSKTSEDANRLRNQSGSAKNLDIGAGIEYYPLNLWDFNAGVKKYAPYVLITGQYVSARPEANTTDPDLLYSAWAPGSVNDEQFTTLAISTGIGLRYKVNDYSDLLLEGRIQFFQSDWIDGLNHQLDYNKHNDSAVWLTLGYVVYLN